MSDCGVVAKMQLAEGLTPILGDRVQLQQVILNLVMNAIEAMSDVREGPRELLISTGAAELDGVLVAISDLGPGLTKVGLERAFDAFYTSKPNGLGMGLLICRLIVEAHGGRLVGRTQPTVRRQLLLHGTIRPAAGWMLRVRERGESPTVGVLSVKTEDTPCKAARRSEIRLVRSRARVTYAGPPIVRACCGDQKSGQPACGYILVARHDASNAAR